MSDSKAASFLALIPPENRRVLGLLKGVQKLALRLAFSKDIRSYDRTKMQINGAVTGALIMLRKEGGPSLDRKAVINEIIQIAVGQAAKATSALAPSKKARSRPTGDVWKAKQLERGVVNKFKLPTDVITPITGTSKIDPKYRAWREPVDPVGIRSRMPYYPPPFEDRQHQEYRGGAHHEATSLASALEMTALEDDGSSQAETATSSRLPTSYTVNTLAADLQLYSL